MKNHANQYRARATRQQAEPWHMRYNNHHIRDYLSHFVSMNTFAVVWLKGEDAVRMLNAAGTQLNWLGRRYAEHRIAVFDSLTREDIKLCAKIAKKYDMIYCPPAMAGHILSTVANAKEVPDVGGKQGSNKGNG